MKTRWLVALFITAVFAQISIASANEVRWGQYLHDTDGAGRSPIKVYLDGAIDALVTYNDQVPGSSAGAGGGGGHKAGSPLFCLPSRFPLTNEQADNIMRRWAAKQTQNIDVVPISAVLLGGLIDTFPCQ